MDQNLLARARAWIASDPDPRTRAELAALLDAAQLESGASAALELADRLDGRLAFGTAGIRGEVAAGSNRINLAVVRQTAWALAQVLIGRPSAASSTVIVGNDARPDSPAFAADMAATLAAAGLDVWCFEAPVPTPIVAFHARAVGAAAAVVVTASHNPRADNGIKVYDDHGVQIVGPWDTMISAAIADTPAAVDIMQDQARVRHLGAEVEAAYRQALVSRLPTVRPTSSVVVVATALHGVGAGPLTRLLGDAGHRVEHVAAQEQPDGTFPTLAFPNPEEPGALDLALDLARRRGADIVLANDPDADRLAVALPDGQGGHAPLTGNDVGVLLADALLQERAGQPTSARLVVASSIVSSPQLAVLAASHGAEHRWTLTGFKWIWNALLDAERAGAIPVLGYEEALGYAVDPSVRDKDGLSAALAIVDLAAREADRGRTLADRLDAIAMVTGVWASAQVSARFAGDDAAESMAAAMAMLRTTPPTRLADHPIRGATDFAMGAETRPSWLGAQNLLSYELGRSQDVDVEGRVLVRPSGTEPKLKVYVDLRASIAGPTDPRAGLGALRARATTIGAEVLRALGLA